MNDALAFEFMRRNPIMPALFILPHHIQSFRQALLHREYSLATVIEYVRTCEIFSEFCKKSGDDPKCNKETLPNWKKSLMIQGLQPSTVNTKLAAVNSFFRFLGHPEHCVKQVRRQRKVFREQGRDLSRTEYLRLLQTARAQGKQRLCLVMQTICSTGIRVGELRFITVAAVSTGRVTVTGKGKCREILLPRTLCKRLKRYLKQIQRWPQESTKEESVQCTESVFLTSGGKPLDRSNLWREMRALCKAAGVDSRKVFPHNLRHLFAKTFYAIDKDIAKLADLLGHASIETTRIYIMETGIAHARLLERLHLLL